MVRSKIKVHYRVTQVCGFVQPGGTAALEMAVIFLFLACTAKIDSLVIQFLEVAADATNAAELSCFR
uniref:Uncharacterized protein n=1 Tax=Ditylenchus dipsaci TaxID=166011 RepID=A0A915DM64_9BILA